MAKRIVVTAATKKKVSEEIDKVIHGGVADGLESLKDEIMKGHRHRMTIKAIVAALKSAGVGVSTKTLSDRIKKWTSEASGSVKEGMKNDQNTGE